MKDGPDISKVASMIGDPARANMLMALMSGMALTAKELAAEAGVTPSTASTHLAQLESCELVRGRRQGRYRYFDLANTDVAHAVEALVTLAAHAGHLRTRPGPRDDKMREARSCYDHLAGRVAVEMFDRWVSRGILEWRSDEVVLTERGEAVLSRRGIDVGALRAKRRPLCRTCIDWSERKNHLGGSVGAAVFAHMLANGWAFKKPGARTVVIEPRGEKAFVSWYETMCLR